MSNLRAQFVGNTNAYSPDMRLLPSGANPLRRPSTYQGQPQRHSQQRPDYAEGGRVIFEHPNNGPRAGLAPTSDTHDSNAPTGPYGVSNRAKDPFEQRRMSFQPSDPFQNPRIDAAYGYAVVPQPNGAVPAAYNRLPPDEKHLLEKDILQNERNRCQLAKRHPPNHFTKLPWFSMIVTLAQFIVFIVELVKMGIWTGSPFQTQPYFNPMLGPSTYVLINMGARYVPCMHKLTGITLDLTIRFPCPNSTTVDTNVCNLNELCGLSGIPVVDNTFAPSQYYRIVLPIFLHAGILHIFFNMFLQLTMGLAVERSVGWLKYGIIYITSGVSGFLLGANFSPNGIASAGASGSLFGIIATNFLLFIYCGTKNTNIYETKRYKTFIFIMIMEVVVSFVLGLLPGLDNFSHIGGFAMGALVSVVLLPDPCFVFVNGIYTYEPDTPTWKLFVDNWNPLSKYKNKVPWKHAVWSMVRICCLALAIVYFALLTKNLKSKKSENNEETCSWCKYINCIPVNGWCDQGEVTVSDSGSRNSPTPTPTLTSQGVPTTTGVIFRPPTETAYVRRFLLEEVPGKPHNSVPTVGANSKHIVGDFRSDMGSVAVLFVLAFLGYKAVQNVTAKVSWSKAKRSLMKERKLL